MVNSHVFGICILEHKRGFVSDSDYRSAVLSNMQSAKTYYNADMNQTEKKILRRKLITGTLTFCALLIGLYFLVDWLNLSIDDIIHYTPQNKILAGLVFMLFYALKSVTVFFSAAADTAGRRTPVLLRRSTVCKLLRHCSFRNDSLSDRL